VGIDGRGFCCCYLIDRRKVYCFYGVRLVVVACVANVGMMENRGSDKEGFGVGTTAYGLRW